MQYHNYSVVLITYLKDKNIIPITKDFIFDQNKVAVTFLFIVSQRSFNDIALTNNFDNSYYFLSEELKVSLDKMLVLLN